MRGGRQFTRQQKSAMRRAGAGWRRLALAALAALPVVSQWSIVPPVLGAPTQFFVDSVGDETDATPGDGICSTAGGSCTIRAAVVEANALGGGIDVNVPAGTYGIAAPITVTGDVMLAGAGAGATLLQPTGSTSPMFSVAAGASLAIVAAAFDGAGGSVAWAAIDGSDGSLSLRDVAAANSHWAAAYVQSGADRATVEVLRSTFTDVRYPVFFADGVDQSLDLRESTITRADWYGVYVATRSGTFRLTDVQINEGYHGVYVSAGNALDGDSPTSLELVRTTISDVAGQGVQGYGRLMPSGQPNLSVLMSDSSVLGGATCGVCIARADAVIDRSTIADNGASSGYGPGLDHAYGALTLTRSTVSGNGGVGLSASNGGSVGALTVANVTITDTVTDGDSYDAVIGTGYTAVSIDNTTIAGATYALSSRATAPAIRNSVFDGTLADCDASVGAVGGHNAATDTTCGFASSGDVNTADLLLGPLADNSGATLTRMPLSGSPLIDAGDPATCLATDQRGIPRPADGDGDGTATCDIGAVEVGDGVGPVELHLGWSSPTARRGLLAADGLLTLTLAGGGGGSAAAHVDVQSWFTDGDPLLSMLAAPAAATLDIALQETSPGTYTGQLALEGIERVDAISADLVIGGVTQSESASERLPATVAGVLQLDTSIDVAPWALPNPRVTVRSASINDGDSVQVPLEGTATTRWLQPGDYVLALTDSQNRTVASIAETARVRGGLRTPLNIAVSPMPYIPFSVRLVDANGQPVSGVRVTLIDDATNTEVAKATSPQDGRISGVARSAAVTVMVDPGDLPYLPATLHDTLTALDEVIDVGLGASLPTAVISGTILHPDRPPVAGAHVSLTTAVGGRLFTTATIAGDGGHYRAVVFQGFVTVVVDEPRAGHAEVEADVTDDTVIDLTLDGPAVGTVSVELLTRLAGEASPTPVPLTLATGAHYHVFVADPVSGRSYSVVAPSIDMPVRAGEILRVCADGWEAGLTQQCVEVVVDPDTLQAQASLLLEQAGRIEGFMRTIATGPDESTGYNAIGDATLRRVDGTTLGPLLHIAQPRASSAPVQGQPLDFPLSFGVPEPGTYELSLRISSYAKHLHACDFVPACIEPGWEWQGDAQITLRLDVADGDVILLGEVPLERCNRANCTQRFTYDAGTGVAISPTQVRPGDTARLRAAATNHPLIGDPIAVEDARIRIELPVDTSVVPGSVTLDGVPVAFTVAGGVLEVAAGTIEPDATRVVQAWVVVDPATRLDAFYARGTIVYGPDAVVESLGTGAAAVSRITLDVGTASASLQVPVSGRGFLGSPVEVLVDGVVVATALPGPGGLWQATVELPSVPLAKQFVLKAITEIDGTTFKSDPRPVWFDPTAPELRRVRLYQDGNGDSQVIDPAAGVARFPFVWVPDYPVHLDLDFSHADRVTDPVVWIGDVSEQATFDPDTGTWRVSMWPNGGNFGKVVVAWNAGAEQFNIAPTQQPDPWTNDEIRAYLPVPFNTFTGLQVTQLDDRTITASATLPDVDDSAVQVTLATTAGLYEPTADDLQRAAAIGAPIWDFQLDIGPGADGGTQVAYRFFIPDSALNPASGSSVVPASARLGPVAPLAPAAAGVATGVYVVETVWTQVAWQVGVDFVGGGLMAGSNANTLPDQIELLRSQVNATCDATQSSLFYTLLDRLFRDHWVNAFVQPVLGLLAGAFAPATAGLGTLAIWGVMYLIDQGVGNELSARLAAIQARVDAECQPLPPHPTPEKEDCDRAIWFDACDVIGDPEVIVDPSGFTYEVFPDERLAGVTATLESAPAAEGPWSIWDADWYLQSNPVLTDGAGRYGWDVPMGWWRVRFEKAGYATAYSDVLQVLPPHFNVNVGLERLGPPGIADAAGFEGETFLEVRFESWMVAAGLTPETVTVVDVADDPVPVAIELPDAAVSPDHGEVARTVRLDLGRPLVDGEIFRITIDGAVPTYAGVIGVADLSVDITVVPRPVLPAPTLSTTPSSPSGAAWMAVYGDGTPGASVDVHADATCGGASVETTDVDADGHWIAWMRVEPSTTSTFSARQSLGFAASACSAPADYRNDVTPPSAPVLTGTDPVSPGTRTDISVAGTAEPGTTVSLHFGSTCAAAAVATGTAAQDGQFSVSVSVEADSTTELRADARDAAGNLSGCSDPVTYVHRSSMGPACLGTAGMELSAAIVDGPSFVLPGSADRWLVELTLVACEDIEDIRARGGSPAWATTTPSTEDGEVQVRTQKRNAVLTWLIDGLLRDGFATLRLEVDGQIGRKAACGSTIAITSAWSGTATAIATGAQVGATVAPIEVTVSCLGSTSLVWRADRQPTS
jgi:hypothetical protein